MIVNVEDVMKLKAEIAKINDLPIEEIEWHKDGKKIEIYKADVDFWKYVGLSNLYFLEQIGIDC